MCVCVRAFCVCVCVCVCMCVCVLERGGERGDGGCYILLLNFINLKVSDRPSRFNMVVAAATNF